MEGRQASSARTCGPCHMCCRVFFIPEALKDNIDWCASLDRTRGCRIYETRPAACRDFLCGWRRDENLGEEWRPDIAGFVLSDPDPWAILVTCDPDNPSGWRREPYQSNIRLWARTASSQGLFVGVREGERVSLVLEDHEVPLNEPGSMPGNDV